MSKIMIKLSCIALATGLLTYGASAQAALILALSDGDDTEIVTDLNADGSVLYLGSIGDWILNVTIGLADALNADEGMSRLDLSSLNVTGRSRSGGVLQIALTDTDNTVPFGDTNYSVQFGGITAGSISFQSYLDSSNTAFGTETLLYDTGVLGGAYSGTGYGNIGVSGPYSITTVATITHTSGWSISGFNHAVQIPEPAGLALLGAGLLALSVALRGRRARRSQPI